MWEIVKHKLAKLGCLMAIALVAMAVTALTKVVLGWLHYNEANKEALGTQVGEYVGKGLLGCLFIAGLIGMVLQIREELRAKRASKQPPLLPKRGTPTAPPPLPSGSDRCPHCGLTKYHAIGCPNRGRTANN